jgi:molybdate transport system ATP-binding protein
MLYVTHAMDEVTRLADTLVVLDAGRVRVVGPTAQVLAGTHSPMQLGDDASALLEGTVDAKDAQWHLVQVGFAGGSLWLRDTGLALGQRVRLRVLARDVSVSTTEPQHTSIQNLLPCTVDSIEPDEHPSQVLVRLRCRARTGASQLLARMTARAAHTLALVPDKAVWAQVKSAALAK